MQQPIDLASFYAQYYNRPGVDIEGRPSPLYETAISTKDNENVTMLPPETSQSSQEVCLLESFTPLGFIICLSF